MENFILLVDSHHGIYMAQSAMEVLQVMDNVDWSNVTRSDIEIVLDGPNNEDYADFASEILEDITVTIDGHKYVICWNEDLWLVRDNLSDKEWEDFLI